MTVAGAATNNGVYKRSVGLAAKAFIKNNIIFVPVLHSSALQATNFLLDANGSLVSKWNGGEAGSLTQMGGLPKPFEVDTDVVEVTTTRKGVFTADNGDFDSLLGVYTTALDFEETSLYRNSSLADNLHIAGGVLQMYDGDNVAEHGFQIYPETLTSNIPAAGAGSMSDGTYDYVAVYAWTDNFGNIHRSAPSPSVEVELTAGTADQSVEILVPTLRLTQKTNVIIELYRTENNGTLFYKVTDTTTPTANDSTVDTVTITDTIADTSGGSPVLATREALYTTGGVLENIAADGARLITRYKNRIILAGQEDNVLQYSKIALEGAPVEFNDTLTLKIPSDGQTETAIIEMDEKLIIFKESAIYYIAGDGPNNLGEQDNFTEPELISSDIGCSEADSVVLTPLGVMFKSLKGIYVLSNSLNLTYVGDRVEGYNDLTIKSANVVGELNQVRFVTSGDLTLVYNYHLDKWATFTNHGGTSSVVIGNDYYYLRNDESVFKENRTVFSDNGAPIKMRVVTGWLYLGDIQGFQRIYKTLVLGSYKSNHKVKIRVAYDFVNIFKHEKVFDITDFINVNKYGEESPYGEPTTSYYGSSNDTSGNRYQYRVDMKQQKCQSVKLWIEDMQSATVGEGLTISGITFQVGMKGGPFRIESNRQYGTS